MALPALDFRTPEQQEIDHQKWIDKHYLVEGKRYTFHTACYWMRGHGLRKVMEWTAFIKEAECPWSIVACEAGFRTKRAAEKWAKAYLKHGGPPKGFFDPPPADPNEIVYRKTR